MRFLPDGTPWSTPKGGRPKNEIRQAMRDALDKRLQVLTDIADNPQALAADRLRALDMLARYGVGTEDALETTMKGERALTVDERRAGLKAVLKLDTPADATQKAG